MDNPNVILKKISPIDKLKLQRLHLTGFRCDMGTLQSIVSCRNVNYLYLKSLMMPTDFDTRHQHPQFLNLKQMSFSMFDKHQSESDQCANLFHFLLSELQSGATLELIFDWRQQGECKLSFVLAKYPTKHMTRVQRKEINSINVRESLDLLVANAARSTLNVSCCTDNHIIAFANQFISQQTASGFNEIQIVSNTRELGLVEAIHSGYFKLGGSEFDMNGWVSRLENRIFDMLNPWIPLLYERNDACIKNFGVQTFSLTIIMDSNYDVIYHPAQNRFAVKQMIKDLCELISMLRHRLKHILHDNQYKHITYELHTREPTGCKRVTDVDPSSGTELLEFKITKTFACA
eukprot:770248_1